MGHLRRTVKLPWIGYFTMPHCRYGKPAGHPYKKHCRGTVGGIRRSHGLHLDSNRKIGTTGATALDPGSYSSGDHFAPLIFLIVLEIDRRKVKAKAGKLPKLRKDTWMKGLDFVRLSFLELASMLTTVASA
jgi:hypothetical protein